MDMMELKASFVRDAISRGYDDAAAEYFDWGTQIGLSVTRNGVSHAIRCKMPTTSAELLAYLDEWFAARKA